MPCPHNEITIVQRSQRQSAVAAAAYQSGEKLFCEYDQQVKHYPEKRGMQQTMAQLLKQTPAPDKEQNQMAWVQHMNSLKAQAEELVLTELIYS